MQAERARSENIESEPLLRVFPELARMVSEAVSLRRVQRFEVLERAGTEFNRVLVVVSGSVRATQKGRVVGNKITLETFAPGEVVALEEVLRGKKVPYEIEATSVGEVLILPKKNFEAYLRSNPLAAQALTNYNKSAGIRRLAEVWLDRGLPAAEVEKALAQNCRAVDLGLNDELKIPERSAIFGLQGTTEICAFDGEDRKAIGALMAKEWLVNVEHSHLRLKTRGSAGDSAQLLIFEFQTGEEHFDHLAGFDSQLREVPHFRKRSTDLPHRRLNLDWLRKNGYEIPSSELSFADSEAGMARAALENLCLLIGRNVKLSEADAQVSLRVHGMTLSRMGELLERNGLITRAHAVTDSDIKHFPYPALAVVNDVPVVVVSASGDALIVLHPRDQLISIRISELEEWDWRLLHVQDSEFEGALDLARKKNFQNDLKLLAEFGIGAIFKKEKKIFFNVTCLTVFIALCEASLPLMVELITDRILVKKDFHSIKTYITGGLLLLFFVALAKFLDKACRQAQAQKIGLKIRRLFIRNMMQMSGARYAESLSSDFFSRLSLIERIVGVKSLMSTNQASAYIESGIYIAMLGVISPGIGVLGLVCTALMVFANKNAMEHISHEVHGMSDLKRSMRARIHEQLAMTNTMKCFRSEDYFCSRSEQAYLDHQYAIKKVSLYERTAVIQSDLIAGIFSALALGILTYQAFHGDVSPGEFVAIMLLLERFSEPAKEIGHLAGEKRYLNIEETSIARYLIQGDYSYQSRLATESKLLHGGIRFERVSFRYDNTSANCLIDVSFSIEQGQTLAIVGRSGSGKTTLGRMIAGMVRPSFGNVYYDGVESRALSNFTIFDQVSYVSPHNVVFAGTILANIAFGDDHPDLNAVREAAKLACALDFIDGLPSGFHHSLSTGAPELSAGEAIQICLARALYRRPKILVLDELSAMLDPRLVELISENLAHLDEPITTVIITQRLAMVKNVDKIIVVKNGMIVEEGQHGQLLKARKEYAELFLSQVSRY